MLFSMLESLLSPSCFDTYNLSMSSFGCKTLCIIISFLILRFIYRSSFPIHFKNGPKYLIRQTVQVFIFFMRILLQNLVLRSFLVCLRYTFFSFHLFLFDGVCFQYFQILVSFLFSKQSSSSSISSSYYFTCCVIFCFIASYLMVSASNIFKYL